MLTRRQVWYTLHSGSWGLLLAFFLVSTSMITGQGSVAIVSVDDRGATTSIAANENVAVQPFTFTRNLIFFELDVDGRAGSYILDTGAPGLIVNVREEFSDVASRESGTGAGGAMRVSDHHVSELQIGNRTISNYWATGLDLRSLEQRTGQRVDGFVGYDLLSGGELRIDYKKQQFRLLKSQHRPLHGGASPLDARKFFMVDHLPVVKLKFNGRVHYFALDTGAGSNLIDPAILGQQLTTPTDSQINIQGLDGRPVDYPIFEVIGNPLVEHQQFVGIDLDHLQSEGKVKISGILGSPFLSQYTIGIDYRRRKLYFW